MAENFENKATRGSISQIILTALSSGSKYGYEICKDIEKLTNGKLILKQPSLYSSLRRMEEQDLISSYWEDSSLGGKRHYYTLTEKGKTLYEKNKDLWKNQEELLNNLPENTSFSTEDNNHQLPRKEENLSKEEENKSSNTFVLNQENLFNLAKNNEAPKMIKSEDLEEESDKNKSFLQFDFFEQNIKFVKESSDNKNNQEISIFTNKFSNMDNNSAEIEPDEILENQTTFDFNNNVFEDANKNTEVEPERSNYSILASSLLGLNEIKREDVFTNENIIKKEEVLLKDSEEKEEQKYSLENKGTLSENLEQENENIITRDNLNTTMDIDAASENLESISWENSNNIDANKPVFESKDYRGLIGKLYNNSQLKDPYEQNKYHTFKEIFPSSQLKQKEKTEEIYKESAIDAIVESNSNSNIDCDDIKMLNNLYNLQGINIKIHNDIENKKQNKVYTDKNKLNMFCAWIMSIIMLFEVLGTFFILKNNDLIISGQTIVYYLGCAFVLSYGLISTFENIFDRFKLVIIKNNFKKTFITRLLIFIFAIILIFALNLAFGMSSLTQVDFLSFWVVPSLLASNILLEVIVYNILYNTKIFNS